MTVEHFTSNKVKLVYVAVGTVLPNYIIVAQVTVDQEIVVHVTYGKNIMQLLPSDR